MWLILLFLLIMYLADSVYASFWLIYLSKCCNIVIYWVWFGELLLHTSSIIRKMEESLTLIWIICSRGYVPSISKCYWSKRLQYSQHALPCDESNFFLKVFGITCFLSRVIFLLFNCCIHICCLSTEILRFWDWVKAHLLRPSSKLWLSVIC
jgi:hypothetical protein